MDHSIDLYNKVQALPDFTKLSNHEVRAQMIVSYSASLDALIQIASEVKSIPVVTSEDDVATMNEARELRLRLKKIRTNADNTREQLKKDSIIYGKAVQSIYNEIEKFTKPLEVHLLEQEKFAETQQLKREQEQHDMHVRSIPSHLLQYVVLNNKYGTMSKEEFNEQVLVPAQAMFDYQLEKERKRKADDRRALTYPIKEYIDPNTYNNIAQLTDAEFKQVYHSALQKKHEEQKRQQQELAELRARLAKEELTAKVTSQRASFIEEEFPFDDYIDYTIMPTSDLDITVFELENNPKYQFEIRVEQDGVRLESMITKEELIFIYEHIGAMLK